jgi:lysozyme
MALEDITMQTNQKGIELIARFEGLKLKPYSCPAGIPTIGYGSTFYPDGTLVKLTDAAITKAKADEILCHNLAQYEDAVSRAIKVKITSNQFSACVSLAYNIGAGNFQKSSVVKFINAGEMLMAAKSFLMWDKATVNGKLTVLPGLVTRRLAEKALFETN